MRWRGGRRSGNVEDRRGLGMGRGLAAGGGIGTLVIALLVMLLGGDPGAVLQDGGTSGPLAGPGAGPAGSGAETGFDDEARAFVETVLGYTEDTWHPIFQQMGRTYVEPTLVLFSGATRTQCGMGQAAMGPFYCPLDQKVYIDLSFYADLQRMAGARSDFDFAQAYVIAHEVGHHVQNLLGISDEVHAARQRLSEGEGNALSVRLELQADCFAGVWGHHTQQRWAVLESGDVEEALRAASAIGDDRLQRQSQGYVVPESFTHGTSAQRVEWFRRGFESGDARQCDTFAARSL